MKRPDMTGLRAGARGVGLLGAVLAVGAVLMWADLSHAQPAGQSIESILEAKAQRTPAQRKLSSQLLDATGSAQPSEGVARRQARAASVKDEQAPTADVKDEQAPTIDVEDEVVTVDIRADVTPAVLTRIRDLGGTVLSSVPKYRAIRARLPLSALEPLATLEAVRSIRPADQPITHSLLERSAVARAVVTEGDVAHQADMARGTHGVDGTGIGVGVLSDGVDALAAQQATGEVPAGVTVLPGQAGGAFQLSCGRRSKGTEGTAMFEIVHDLAPGAELFFATGGGGAAQMAQNIEDLCAAGADIIVDDIGYLLAPAFQDGVIAQAVSSVVADGCYYFSAAGNGGNLNDGTASVWEGDFAAGTALNLTGVGSGAVYHEFASGVPGNQIVKDSTLPIVLQWADPVDGSAHDYDLFLIDTADNVLASSTNTQDGTQDPIEYIGTSCANDRVGTRLVIVKNAGAADRYLRLNTGGELAIATAGQTFGHSASQDAIGVAAVSARTAGGAGGVFNGTESVETFSSDGPRQMFFEADGTPNAVVLKKPDLAAADDVSTSTPGFSRFRGTSAAAPHAAAIAALMLEAAGGPAKVTPEALRTAMTGSALDIEEMGVDGDSGAGIVMAPGAVDAVDVALADRNGAPTLAGMLTEPTLAPDAATVTLNMASAFTDPDTTDTLTYALLPNDSDRVTVSLSGSTLTLTPRAPGRVAVKVRATDDDGLSAVRSVIVTIAVGSRDYDADDDGLIEIANLAQLDAVRYDLDGDGTVDTPADWPLYDAAFDAGAWDMGCPDGCLGYELTMGQDFDTNGNGVADADDDDWNGGAGWAPIGTRDGRFAAIFAGNGHELANLFIDRPAENRVGLFGYVGRDNEIRDVGLVGVDVTGGDRVGSLAGQVTSANIERSYATGRVTGAEDVGGLVGWTGGLVLDSYTSVRVSGVEAVGGLVGTQDDSRINASYATGLVSGTDAVGGLVGNAFGLVQASYATGSVSGQGTRPAGRWPCWETGGVGGLAGNACSEIEDSYATGSVSGETAVGGLVGTVGTSAVMRTSYWDTDTSGLDVGVGADDANDNGEIDGTESRTAGVEGLTTAALQAPTGYAGIYQMWNLYGDSVTGDSWDFGTSTQYPALKGVATWQEFGYQLRAGPGLTATPWPAQVALSWPAVTTHWTPPPEVTYTIYRDDGPGIEPLVTALVALGYTDTAVTVGATYTYQVAAVVTGGEAARSALTTVSVGTSPPPPPPPGPGGGGGGDSRDLHGDTPAQATRVRLDSTAPWASSTAGQINTADDVDYFAFTLPQAGVLVVETTGSTDTVGTVWQAGEELTSAESGGERRNFRLSTRVAARPVVVAVAGSRGRIGDYTLETYVLAGYLENPGPNSFQSGIGVLSGWVCTADEVEIEIETEGGDTELQMAAYGTERLDTEGVCGDTDNGFGLLFNWNRLGDGVHTVVALVDEVELGRATVTVTTLGQEFLQGAEGECVVGDFPRLGQRVTLEWQQNSQNFTITDFAVSSMSR